MRKLKILNFVLLFSILMFGFCILLNGCTRKATTVKETTVPVEVSVVQIKEKFAPVVLRVLLAVLKLSIIFFI